MHFSRVLGAAALLGSVTAIDLDVESEDSIKDAAGTMAYGMISRYTGNLTGDVPGNLPDPYHWWTTGAMFGALIDYWYLTGDESYVNTTMQAIVHQAAPTRDFMPDNQTLSMGNDDQGFWAMTAMQAAEWGFPNPEPDEPQYLALAQACFNQWTQRWDEVFCHGGLRWQVHEFHVGYNYKNSISNGCFFNVAARLARYTGNDTYAEWAEKIWDWQTERGIITDTGRVYDGAHIQDPGEDCPPTDNNRWTYNAGIFMGGAAVMANYTGESKWADRVELLLDSSEEHFMEDGLIVEQRCEPHGFCNIDQRTFKGYLFRWMSLASLMLPDMYERFQSIFRTNAVAAARSCVGQIDGEWRGIPNTACGLKWTTGAFDGSWGVGENMNALSAVMYLLSDQSRVPFTNATGGTSRGDPNAGSESHDLGEMAPITTADRAGAGILTALICMGLISGVFWLMHD